jgi:hypothetical protein
VISKPVERLVVAIAKKEVHDPDTIRKIKKNPEASLVALLRQIKKDLPAANSILYSTVRYAFIMDENMAAGARTVRRSKQHRQRQINRRSIHSVSSTGSGRATAPVR